MSKQEMIMYKNKYRLWVILHPNVSRGCGECKHVDRGCGGIGVRTLIYDRNTDEIEFSEKPQEPSKGIVCIEWIKHV